MPYASKICSIFPLWMESEALVKLTNSIVACRFFARMPSRILWIVNTCEVVDLFLQKPFWFFWRTLSIALPCRSSMSLNCPVFHTSGGIPSSPVAFLFLIFLSTEWSSSWVKGPSLMSNCLLINLLSGSCGGFPCRFLKCCFHSFIPSYWFVAFNLALAVLFLLLTSFIVCHAILDCLGPARSNKR